MKLLLLLLLLLFRFSVIWVMMMTTEITFVSFLATATTTVATVAAAYTHGGPVRKAMTRGWLPPSNGTSWTDDDDDNNKHNKNLDGTMMMSSSRTALCHLQKPFSFLTNPPWWRDLPTTRSIITTTTTTTAAAACALPLTPADTLLCGLGSCLSVMLLSHLPPIVVVSNETSMNTTTTTTTTAATTTVDAADASSSLALQFEQELSNMQQELLEKDEWASLKQQDNVGDAAADEDDNDDKCNTSSSSSSPSSNSTSSHASSSTVAISLNATKRNESATGIVDQAEETHDSVSSATVDTMDTTTTTTTTLGESREQQPVKASVEATLDQDLSSQKEWNKLKNVIGDIDWDNVRTEMHVVDGETGDASRRQDQKKNILLVKTVQRAKERQVPVETSDLSSSSSNNNTMANVTTVGGDNSSRQEVVGVVIDPAYEKAKKALQTASSLLGTVSKDKNKTVDESLTDTSIISEENIVKTPGRVAVVAESNEQQHKTIIGSSTQNDKDDLNPNANVSNSSLENDVKKYIETTVNNSAFIDSATENEKASIFGPDEASTPSSAIAINIEKRAENVEAIVQSTKADGNATVAGSADSNEETMIAESDVSNFLISPVDNDEKADTAAAAATTTTSGSNASNVDPPSRSEPLLKVKPELSSPENAALAVKDGINSDNFTSSAGRKQPETSKKSLVNRTEEEDGSVVGKKSRSESSIPSKAVRRRPENTSSAISNKGRPQSVQRKGNDNERNKPIVGRTPPRDHKSSATGPVKQKTVHGGTPLPVGNKAAGTKKHHYTNIGASLIGKLEKQRVSNETCNNVTIEPLEGSDTRIEESAERVTNKTDLRISTSDESLASLDDMEVGDTMGSFVTDKVQKQPDEPTTTEPRETIDPSSSQQRPTRPYNPLMTVSEEQTLSAAPSTPIPFMTPFTPIVPEGAFGKSNSTEKENKSSSNASTGTVPPSTTPASSVNPAEVQMRKSESPRLLITEEKEDDLSSSSSPVPAPGMVPFELNVPEGAFGGTQPLCTNESAVDLSTSISSQPTESRKLSIPVSEGEMGSSTASAPMPKQVQETRGESTSDGISQRQTPATPQLGDSFGLYSSPTKSVKRPNRLKSTIGPENVSPLASSAPYMVPEQPWKQKTTNNTSIRADSMQKSTGSVGSHVPSMKSARHASPLKSSIGFDRFSPLVGDAAMTPTGGRDFYKQKNTTDAIRRSDTVQEMTGSVGSHLPSQSPIRRPSPLKSTFGADRVSSLTRDAPYMVQAEPSRPTADNNAINSRRKKRVFTPSRSANETLAPVPATPKSAAPSAPPTLHPLQSENPPATRPNPKVSSTSAPAPASAPFMVPFEPIVPEGAFGGAKPSYTYQPVADASIPPAPKPARRSNPLMSVSDEESLASSAPVPAPFMTPRLEPLVPEGAFGDSSTIPPTLQPLQSESPSIKRPVPEASSTSVPAPASAPFMVPFEPIVPEGAFGGAKPSYTYQPAADVSIPPAPQQARRTNPLMSVSDEESLASSAPVPAPFMTPRREPLVPEGAFGPSSTGEDGPSVTASAAAQASASATPSTLQPLRSESPPVTRPNPEASSASLPAPASAPFMVPFEPIVPEGAFGGAKPSYTYQPAADASIPPAPQPVRRNDPLMSVSEEEVFSSTAPAPEEFIISATKKASVKSVRVPRRSTKRADPDGTTTTNGKLNDPAPPVTQVAWHQTRETTVPENIHEDDRAFESPEKYSDPNEAADTVSKESSGPMNFSSHSSAARGHKKFARPLVTEEDLASAFERISRVSFESTILQEENVEAPTAEETSVEQRPDADYSVSPEPPSSSSLSSVNKKLSSAFERMHSARDSFVADVRDEQVGDLRRGKESSETNFGAGFDAMDPFGAFGFEAADSNAAQEQGGVVPHEYFVTENADESVGSLPIGEESEEKNLRPASDAKHSPDSVALDQRAAFFGDEKTNRYPGQDQVVATDNSFAQEHRYRSIETIEIDKKQQYAHYDTDHDTIPAPSPRASEPAVSSVPVVSSQEPPKFTNRQVVNKDFASSFKRISGESSSPKSTRGPVVWAPESVDVIEGRNSDREGRGAAVPMSEQAEPSMSSILSSLPRDPAPDTSSPMISNKDLASAFKKVPHEPHVQLDRNAHDEVVLADETRASAFERMSRVPLESSAHDENVSVPERREVKSTDESRTSEVEEMLHKSMETSWPDEKAFVPKGGKPESADSMSMSAFEKISHDSFGRNTHSENVSALEEHERGGADAAPARNEPIPLDSGQSLRPFSPHLQEPVTSVPTFAQRSSPKKISRYAPNNASWKTVVPKVPSSFNGQLDNSNNVLERPFDLTVDGAASPTPLSSRSDAVSRFPGARRDSSSRRFSSYAPDKAAWKASALELNKRVLFGGGKPVEKPSYPAAAAKPVSPFPPQAAPAPLTQNTNKVSAPPPPPPSQVHCIPESPYSNLASPLTTNPSNSVPQQGADRSRRKPLSYLESLSNDKNLSMRKPWMYRPNRPFGNSYIANLNGESFVDRNKNKREPCNENKEDA